MGRQIVYLCLSAKLVHEGIYRARRETSTLVVGEAGSARQALGSPPELATHNQPGQHSLSSYIGQRRFPEPVTLAFADDDLSAPIRDNHIRQVQTRHFSDPQPTIEESVGDSLVTRRRLPLNLLDSPQEPELLIFLQGTRGQIWHIFALDLGRREPCKLAVGVQGGESLVDGDRGVSLDVLEVRAPVPSCKGSLVLIRHDSDYLLARALDEDDKLPQEPQVSAAGVW